VAASRATILGKEVHVQISITERHCEVGKKTRERAEVRIAQLSRFESRASLAEVVFSEGKRSKTAEVVMHIDGAPHVHARGEGDSFRTALDQVADRLSRMLKGQREQRRDHQAPPLSARLSEE
jgi:ribosomal subunit interface protein